MTFHEKAYSFGANVSIISASPHIGQVSMIPLVDEKGLRERMAGEP